MTQKHTAQIQSGNPLEYKPITQLLISFSLPAIISCLINSIYNIVDQIFIGQGVGYLGNAATTIAFPVMTIILAFGTLIGAGSSANAAISLGERKDKRAEIILNNAFALAVASGIALMAIGLLFLEPILTLFGATEASMPYAIDYTSIILIGTPFNLISIVLSNLARTDGHPRLSMYGMMIGAGLNTILDPIYIFVFHWGVKGAAIATITSQIISAVVLTSYFLRDAKKPQHMRLHLKSMVFVPRLIKRSLLLGISSGITQSVACIMQIVLNNSLVFYGNLESAGGGDIALSAMGIVSKISMILASIAIGFGIGAQPILGFNRGAEKYDRIRTTYRLCSVMASVCLTAGWAMCQLFPEAIISLFGNENAAFTDFAVKCMRIYLFGIFCAGFQIVSTNYFQATGQPLKAAVLSSLRQLVLLIPLILILPRFFGLNGILFAGPVADISSTVIVTFFVIPELKRLNRHVREQAGRMQNANPER